MLLKSALSPEQIRFRQRPQKPLLLLQDFLRRNQNVMEISFNGAEYKDAASCRSTFAKAIRYYGLEDLVAVRATRSKVYLLRLGTPNREEE